jgi:hypothetical protein
MFDPFHHNSSGKEMGQSVEKVGLKGKNGID